MYTSRDYFLNLTTPFAGERERVKKEKQDALKASKRLGRAEESGASWLYEGELAKLIISAVLRRITGSSRRDI